MSEKRNIPKAIFSRRLKEARQRARLSQKSLGIAAGIDDFVASTRINRYELGVHAPDITTASNLARVLNVPMAYFYAQEDNLAQIILAFNQLSFDDQNELLHSVIRKK